MKYLCICQYGHSRSVAMCRELHRRKLEAVACGYGTAPSAIAVLGEWADRILILASEYTIRLPELKHLQQKVIYVPIGPDKWSNPYHPELAEICKKWFEENLT